MKYYIIAGEASGDLHGSNLMKSIFFVDKNAEIRFWGGDLMKEIGGTLVSHYKERAFMGFFEVIKNLRMILSFIKFCKIILTFLYICVQFLITVQTFVVVCYYKVRPGFNP